MHTVVLAILILACGVTFRIRGGLLAGTPVQTPGNVSRVSFAIVAALTGWWCDVLLQASCWVAVAWFIGCMPGWSHSIDLGKNEDTFWRDLSMISIRGFIWPLLPAIVLTVWPFVGYHESYPNAWAMPFFGLFLGPIYWIGSLFKTTAWGLGTKLDYVPRGEFLGGLMYGLSIILTV